MNVLLLTHKLPWPLHDGYNLHNYNYLVQLAARGHRFHLVSLGTTALPMEVAGQLDSVRIVAPRPAPPPPSLLRRVTTALSVDEVFEFDPAVLAAAREVLAAHPIDVVWTAGAKMLVYSRRLGGAPVLGDIADEAAKEALTDLRRARRPLAVARGLKNLANTWRYQRKYLAHARICTVVSEVDRAVLQRNCPGLDVRVVPNGVDATLYSPSGLPQRFPSLVFEGAMDFRPNVEGVVDFCRRVLPLVLAERPDVRFTIVGKNPVPEVAALAGEHVQVTGFVDDVRPWVEQASVFVCPLRRGAGIKNKILQAWALERAVVATSVSVGGLPLREGENLVVADEPVAFARAVLDLLADAGRRAALGHAGRATVLEHCTWERRALQMEEILQQVAGARAAAPAVRAS